MKQYAVIYICFRIPPHTDPPLNRLVAWFNPPACHCEIAFDMHGTVERPSTDVIVSSIYEDTTVFVRKREFKQLCYIQEPIVVSKSQAQTMLAFCHKAERDVVTYSSCGMLSSIFGCCCIYLTPRPDPVQMSKTFCSQHVTMTLQKGGLLQHLHPSFVTPSSLLKEIQSGKKNLTINSCYTSLPSRIDMVTL